MGNFLVTGGAGFVGFNITKSLLDKGYKVTVYDNLSRNGVEENLSFLNESYGNNLTFIKGDIRDKNYLKKILENSFDFIFHCAAQVGMISSLEFPDVDFDINAVGTLNLLEGIRLSNYRPAIFFPSSNKVYGSLEDITFIEKKTRYTFEDPNLVINESFHLNADNPYACSKLTAENYIRLYSKLYNISFVIFRMSCIWGNSQHGNEDQGWISHLLNSIINNKTINIYGNGKQVRDVLHISDLTNAVHYLIDNLKTLKNTVYNMGGGIENTLSVLEFIELCEKKLDLKAEIVYKPWRYSDQKVYISDSNSFMLKTGWKPLVTIVDELTNLSEQFRNKNF